MTYEEFKLIIDGVIWNLNEQSKKVNKKIDLNLCLAKKKIEAKKKIKK
jgi:hypothetical protein